MWKGDDGSHACEVQTSDLKEVVDESILGSFGKAGQSTCL